MSILIWRRNWALRLSIILNVCVLLYVCLHLGAVPGPWIEDSSGWTSSSGGNNGGGAAAGPPSTSDLVYGTAAAASLVLRPNGTAQTVKSPEAPAAAAAPAAPALAAAVDTSVPQQQQQQQQQPAQLLGDGPKVEFKANETKTVLSNEVVVTDTEKKPNETTTQKAKKELTLQEAINCCDKFSKPKIAQRGDYWVFYNYVPMSTKLHCWESVTYTTHADYTFLDNLEPLLERWKAPISIALHAPGTDLAPTIEAIKYARTCGSPLVAQFVTFHVYFSSKHVPKMIPSGAKVAVAKANCSKPAPWVNASVAKMYKSQHKLLYPVNVGRNVARESALTHYVLASDIELYPSPGLAKHFLEMIRRNDHKALRSPNPKVFVLSIFEVDEKSRPPDNKTQLKQMLKSKKVIPFHQNLCASCHNVPKSKEWQETPETPGLHVFHVGKRIGSFIHWEPIYIGTNQDPLYDERLSWEGKSDKMTQGYALCVMDYDFLILDNAFLVHRPGIKIYKKDNYRDTLAAKTNILIKKIILPELKIIYGTRKGCAV